VIPPRIEVHAGLVSELSRGHGRVVRLPPVPWDLHREAVVILDANDQPRAYLNRCKHLPIPLALGGGSFFDSTRRYLMCATHGALYETTSGFCISGPCRGQVLTPIELRVDADGSMALLLEG
jgi:nitrite reductase/ring-hydroxylating ferredoxin subunit